jgi:hypothetical protein
MSEQPTIATIITLEQAIQRLIHDLRVPERLRTALAIYQDLGADLSDFEIGMPRAQQTEATCLPKTIGSSLAVGCQDRNSRNAPCEYREYRCILNCGDAAVGQGIIIVLWHNKESLDWSVKINGLRHEHVTSEVVEALVECAVIAAQMSLTRALAQRPQ